MSVPVYISDGTATVSTATRSDGRGASTRLPRKYAGIAASDISTDPIVFAAAYASGTAPKSFQAGAMRIG